VAGPHRDDHGTIYDAPVFVVRFGHFLLTTLLEVKVRKCAGFRTAAMTWPATGWETGVGKAPRHEIAGDWGMVGAAGSMGI
jgi:hypothetical protein